MKRSEKWSIAISATTLLSVFGLAVAGQFGFEYWWFGIWIVFAVWLVLSVWAWRTYRRDDYQQSNADSRMSDRPLTEFQRQAQQRLEALVAQKGQHLALKRGGRSETFLTGTLVPSGIDVWIYEDGLEFKGSGRRALLERPDFSSLEGMLEYFLQELATALS